MMLLDSIKEIYISNNKPKTWEHVQEVAETAIWLAERHRSEVIQFLNMKRKNHRDPDRVKDIKKIPGWK